MNICQIFKNQLFSITGREDASFLLAISGGVDSMVMASLFVAAQYKKITVAHVNFGLRGAESDADEALVRDWAEKVQFPCLVTKFDTRAYAATHKLSVEMAARALRYQWFEELQQTLQIDYVAVAHHANDHAETILLNLTRGTGIRGLCGISPARGSLIRPMLAFDRKQIEAYSKEMNVPFREDATNASSDFSRNRIRHNVLPELAKINPNVVERLYENGRYFRQASDILGEMLEEKKQTWCRQEGEAIFIDIEKVTTDAHASFWLFELLRPLGFHERQMKQVVAMLHAQPGGSVGSKSHVLFRDRNCLALLPQPDGREATDYQMGEPFDSRMDEPSDSLIGESSDSLMDKPSDSLTDEPSGSLIGESSGSLMDEPSDSLMDKPSGSLTFDSSALTTGSAACTLSLHDSSEYVIKNNPFIAALDADTLHLPLSIREWQKGDRFIPLGMKGYKKVSDFLIDAKVPLWKKKHQQVLCSAHNIVWVVGKRIDERFKVTESTKRVAEISYYQ